MQIGEYEFRQTCGACPEQYDVFDRDGNQVAYVRLRWGCVSAKVPDCSGADIYCDDVGDGMTGCFESDKQRRIYLTRIAHRLTMYSSEIHCPECDQPYKLNIFDLDELDEDDEIWRDCETCNDIFRVGFKDKLIGLHKEYSVFDRSELVVKRRYEE